MYICFHQQLGYFQLSSILHHLYLLGTHQLPHCCPVWILLLLENLSLFRFQLSMSLVCNHFIFLLLVLILVILLLCLYHYHWYQIHMIFVSLRVHPHQCTIPQKPLTKFLLQYRLNGFIHQILCINFLSCRPKWVILVCTKTLDIGQRWVVPKFLLVSIPYWQLHCLWVIPHNHWCESIFQCTATWRSVLHPHSITLRKYRRWLFSSMCFLWLCIPWHRIQRKSSSY